MKMMLNSLIKAINSLVLHHGLPLLHSLAPSTARSCFIIQRCSHTAYETQRFCGERNVFEGCVRKCVFHWSQSKLKSPYGGFEYYFLK